MNCKHEIKQHGNFMVLGMNIFNDGKCFIWGKNDVIYILRLTAKEKWTKTQL